MACKSAVSTPPNPLECCSGVKHADMHCLCSYKNSNLLPSLGIDPKLAMQLPQKCKFFPHPVRCQTATKVKKRKLHMQPLKNVIQLCLNICFFFFCHLSFHGCVSIQRSNLFKLLSGVLPESSYLSCHIIRSFLFLSLQQQIKCIFAACYVMKVRQKNI